MGLFSKKKEEIPKIQINKTKEEEIEEAANQAVTGQALKLNMLIKKQLGDFSTSCGKVLNLKVIEKTNAPLFEKRKKEYELLCNERDAKLIELNKTIKSLKETIANNRELERIYNTTIKDVEGLIKRLSTAQ